MLRKRIASALLVVCMLLMCLPVTAFADTTTAASGTCGDNLTWELDSEGTLTVSGTGEMWDFSWRGHNDEIKTVVIEDGVTSIGYGAFYGCSSLTSVTIPDSVTSIGKYVFYGCSSLTSITIPDSVTSIGRVAFNGCENLKAVYITDLSAWCNISFEAGDSNPLCYEGKLYLNGDLVTDLIIPDGVTSIGDYAFLSCDSLTSITVPNSVNSIGKAAFQYCSSLASITIPDSVTSIGDNAFYNCSSLTSITIPDGVTSIGEEAFSYCSGLTSITFPDSVTSIDNGAFYGCSSLTSITIPDSVTSIGNYAFCYCDRLTSITIPDGVTSIGAAAFFGCENLKAVYITDLSAWCNISFESVDSHPLYYAGNLYLNGDLVTNVIIPDGVTSIGDRAFYSCSSLTSITIPDSVTSIDESAFQDCYSLTSITIPDGVTSIGDYAFDWCTHLSKIVFLGDAPKIYDGCFTGVKATAYYPADNSTWTKGVMQNYGGDITWVSHGAGHVFDNACDTSCNVCGAARTTTHSYTTTTTKATTTTNGSIVKKCTVCGKVASTTTIKYAKTFSLSTTSYTYNGVAKKPAVTVKDSAGKTLTNGTDYTVTYPSSRTNAGTYKITVTMKGNYTGTKTLTFKINPAKIGSCQLSTTSYTYNGVVKKPAVTVKNSSGAKLSTSAYTVTYASGCKNVGTYQVTIKGKGNYTGTKTLTFKINPAKIGSCQLSTTSYTYDGNVKKPAVTVKNSSGAKLSTTAYTVTYSSGRKNVGTYKVTIKGKGNYTGTKTLTFKINPVKTTVSKLTAGQKSITVGITKKSTQVTGYQIQYSTSSKFTNASTKTITSYKTTKYTLKSLSAKKTYYVRVRTYKTVNGTKYYSGWSTYKYVKTK